MTFSFAPNDQPLFVSEGDFVQFQFQAPNTWNTTETVTIQIGDLTQFWFITTIPEDFTPDPFPFQAVNDAPLSTLFTYADGSRAGETIIEVTGLTPTTQAPISISSNKPGDNTVYALRIDRGAGFEGWFQPTPISATTVENGDRVQIRARSSSFPNDVTIVTVVIGTSSEQWLIATESIPVNEPVPFPVFDNLSGLSLNEVAYSNVLRISGLTTDALVSLTNSADYAISNTNTTSVNVDGYDVLSGVTFGTGSDIANGQYLQLRLTAAGTANTPRSTDVSVGDINGGSSWTITTGAAPATSPDSFSFTDKTNVQEDTLIASDTKTISGLGVPVEVTLITTDSTNVRIKVNNGSIGFLPVTVENGDTITLYQQSNPDFGFFRSTQIRVGTRAIPLWSVQTNFGPDFDAVFTPPLNLTNQVPDTFAASSSITPTDFNRPITITATNGALISIDFGPFSSSPVTFDPSINTSFRIGIQTSGSLNTLESTDVVVGTEATDIAAVSFTWETTTYATAPPPLEYKGVWYSKKVKKFDGYPIGTILPILKQNVVNVYGNLSGDNDSRYPGFVACDGTPYDASRFPDLWDVIGNTYGGNAFYDDATKTYVGTFNVPDYRNRKLAGVGFVDGNKSSSAGLPVDTIGKSLFDVGAEGGYWYFDKVDASGPNPFEQVIGTGDTGVESEFFTLGSIKLSGLDTVTTEVSFDIQGEVTAQVGPLSDVLVSVPEHDHLYIAAVVETESGSPLNPWEPEGRALFEVNIANTGDVFVPGSAEGVGAPGSFFTDGSLGGRDTWTADQARGWWQSFLGTTLGPSFIAELRRYDPVRFPDAAAIASELNVINAPGPGVNDNINTPLEFLTWWPSPSDVLDPQVADGRLREITTDLDDFPTNPGDFNPDFDPTNQGAQRAVTAIIDTNPSGFNVQSYVPPSGQTNTHSHLITLDPVNNPNTDFGGGNLSGGGSTTGILGQGLGNAASQIQVVFSQDSSADGAIPVFMELTEGVFTFLNNFKSPVPVVELRPQRQIPIINPFHKTKYVIKAY